MIFSLERLLSGGTKLTWEHATKLGKPVLQIYDTRKERILNQDSLRIGIQALGTKRDMGTKRDRSDKKESERRREWNWDRGRKKF